jgi:hypothetical protein
LYDAVDDYVGATDPETSTAARTYGFPMGTWDVSRITNFSRVFDSFERNPALDTFDENLNDWDVSAAKDMSEMFRHTSAFQASDDLSVWKVDQVTNMRYRFADAAAFNGDLSS